MERSPSRASKADDKLEIVHARCGFGVDEEIRTLAGIAQQLANVKKRVSSST